MTGNQPENEGTQQSATEAYAELAKIVVSGDPLGVVLRRVADLASQTITGALDVSVTLIRRGRPATVAFSGDGDLAVYLDERQYERGYGPCMDAAASAAVITIDDTGHDPTYPDFAAIARGRSISHTLSVGLPTAQETSGALNLYGRSGGPFDERAREQAATFAGYASIALLNAALYAGAVEEVAQMREALATRAGIEQAKGIIMLQRRCSADEAFAVLRNLSSTSNRKLRDVAREIVGDAVGDASP